MFGKAQARITQALRRKLKDTELKALLDAPANEDYLQRIDEFRKITGHTRRVLLASLYLLAGVGEMEAVSLIPAVAPDVDLAPLRGVLAERGPGAVLGVLEDTEIAGEDLGRLMAEARAALRGVSRQGFGEETAAGRQGTEAFRLGTGAVLSIGKHVEAFLTRLERAPPDGDWSAQFLGDLAVFSRQFHLLYGGNR